MNKIQKARLENALKVGEKLRSLLQEGYLIFGDNNEIVSRVEFHGFGNTPGLSIYYDGSKDTSTVYMHGDPEWDNGLDTTIEEFNASFDSWKIVHPKHFVKLAGV